MQDGKCTPHVCLENFSRSETISAEFVPEIKTYELKKNGSKNKWDSPGRQWKDT